MALPFVEFLTRERLAEASRGLSLAPWRRHRVLYPLWYELRAVRAALRGDASAVALRPLGGRRRMILFVNPRATRPKNRRFPLSVMAIGAALPATAAWEIVDGNLPDADPLARASSSAIERARGHERSGRRRRVHRDAGTAARERGAAREGAQGALSRRADRVGRQFRRASIPAPVLNAPYVDWLVRGQGEHTFVELLEVLDGTARPEDGRRLWPSASGRQPLASAPERRGSGPDELPAPPYHKIDVADYLHPTFLGRRSGVYQASIGCPYGCKFCGVISVFGSREKRAGAGAHGGASRVPRARARHGLRALLRQQLLRQRGRTRASSRSASRRSGMRWWCEARVDALTRFSDDTWRLLEARRPHDGVLRRGVRARTRCSRR